MTTRLVLPDVNGLDVQAAALAYARAGIAIFPTDPDSKRPLIGSWTTGSTTDETRVLSYWPDDGKPRGIGIPVGRLGEHGGLVVDLDHPELMPDGVRARLDATGTAVSQTQPGRLQYVFLLREGEKYGNAPGPLKHMGCDVRGAGGYIQAPPTVRQAGVYTWQGVTVEERPDWLAEMLTPSSGGSGSGSASPEDVREWMDRHSGGSADMIGRKMISDLCRTLRNAAGSRHGELSVVLPRLVREVEDGAYPARVAVDAVLTVWLDVMSAEDDERQEPEFWSLLRWAIGNVSDGGQDDEPEPEPQSLMQGQLLLAERFAADHDGRLIYVNRLGWHGWDGLRWREGAELRAQGAYKASLTKAQHELVRTHGKNHALSDAVKKGHSTSASDAVIKMARSEQSVMVEYEALDADAFVINCANGTLDLRTMQVRPHDPADRITKVCRAAYRRDGADDVWLNFVAQILPDAEVRGFVQRLFGLSLLGVVREHVLPVFYGPGGRNGKGTLTETMVFAMGDYARAVDPTILIDSGKFAQHTTGLVDLRGMRLMIASETDDTARLAAATVKKLTGGDTITARKMRQDNVTFEPSHLLLLITNYLPRTDGGDAALFARLRVVEFNQRFTGKTEDVGLKDRLRERHLDGALHWAVEGLRDYWERGGLDAPASVMLRTAQYAEDADPLSRFLADRTEDDPYDRTKASDLFKAYESWALSEGIRMPLTAQMFGRKITDRGFAKVKRNDGWYYEGLRLTHLL